MRGIALTCVCVNAGILGLAAVAAATEHRHVPLIAVVLLVGAIASGTWYLRMRRDS